MGSQLRCAILSTFFGLLAVIIAGCAPVPYDARTIEPARQTIVSTGKTLLAQTPSAAPITPGAAATFALSSAAFAEGGTIPKAYSCDGAGISPPLHWTGVPSGTKSLALIVDDPDAPSGTFTHWVTYDILPSQTELPEGARAVGKDGLNGRGQPGYTGPCPPNGTHRYFFKLFALDIASLGLNQGADCAQVEQAMQGHVLGQATLMGKYAR